jgi:hypothetical protein
MNLGRVVAGVVDDDTCVDVPGVCLTDISFSFAYISLWK